MAYYDRQHERERKERETPEHIVHLAQRKGQFEVSLRYRDEWLRKRCKELKKQGLLRGGRRVRNALVYYPVVNL